MEEPVTRVARLPGGPALPYAEQGDPAGTPVVLLHAVGDSWRAFEPLMAGLPAELHVLAPSQRGHGGADCPPQGYRPADFAADLAAFLDLLGIERPVLVGASSAGFTVRRYAADHPGRVRGLVLLGSPALLSDKPEAGALREAVARMADPLDPAVVRGTVESLVARPLPPDFVDLMVQEGLRVPARVWRDTVEALFDETGPEGPDRITAPALLIWGDRDGILPRADQERLAAALPRSALLVHEGSGHIVQWDDPGRTAADLAAFVAACCGGGGQSAA
ncbi:alpha/beta fold hydrolase [Kitasatospora sp. DSM 101779]|uniref:alpha/beta fold hydrolase n=1 Tax=Kitasatospora sp. DSM 101779 TaxID=2853165 RepID=UPI0021DB4B08|nr:alpha/beta hydrolase [Kitasatospora sp. DSM 101779]MCU7826287.1 alpha/beta hydrolase [Kitasatospora sp. DSM 101779]